MKEKAPHLECPKTESAFPALTGLRLLEAASETDVFARRHIDGKAAADSISRFELDAMASRSDSSIEDGGSPDRTAIQSDI